MGQAEQFLARRCDFSFGHRHADSSAFISISVSASASVSVSVRVPLRVRVRVQLPSPTRGNSCVNVGQGGKSQKGNACCMQLQKWPHGRRRGAVGSKGGKEATAAQCRHLQGPWNVAQHTDYAQLHLLKILFSFLAACKLAFFRPYE